MKATLKITTSKAQVTLKRELLDELGVGPGDRIVVEPVAPGRVEIRRAEQRGGLAAFVGCQKQTASPVLSLEDIRKIARDGWARKTVRITVDANVLAPAAVMDDPIQGAIAAEALLEAETVAVTLDARLQKRGDRGHGRHSHFDRKRQRDHR